MIVKSALLALTIAGVVVFLMASWMVLATLYAGPVWLLGFFLNRDLDWRRSWRFCGAALLPGALLMLVAISFMKATSTKISGSSGKRGWKNP